MLIQRQAGLLRPQTTAHLAQTMSLLELSAIELHQKIESALSTNPALELVEENRCPSCHRILHNHQPCPSCSSASGHTADQPIVFLSSREDFTARSGTRSSGEELPDDNFAARVENLPEYVLRQISPELPLEDRGIAVHILTSLDEDGLLDVTPLEIAQYHHVPRSRVEAVMRRIQHAEPLGVGSPSPQEALLVQLEVLSESRPVPTLAAKAVLAGMDLLTPHRSADLARQLEIPVSQAREIVRFISDNLNPFPSRAHWGEFPALPDNVDQEKNVFHFPDIIITRANANVDTPLVVEIAMPFYGTLRVNPLFREALREAPDEKAGLWQEDLEQATLLVKCLQQRNHTIVRLMEKLTVLQREFILNGDSCLHPVTRAELADELAVHESTMSRAVSDKAVQLPSRRIVPLSMFFDRSLHIRTALKDIIENESNPLSDTQLASELSKQGFPVARRTVAKYRAIEGILPAHLRNHTRQPQPSPANP